MKKTIFKIGIIAAGLLLLVSNARAQQGFQFGVQGIPQMSWLMNKDDRNNGNFEYLNTYDAAFGLYSQYGFNESMAIGLDAIYSLQGQRYKLFGTERYRRVEYLKIPITFINYIYLTERVNLFYKIGPQLGIVATARLTDKDGNNIVSDQKGAYENAELDIMAAAGVGIKINERFVLDLAVRYDFGVTDAENKDYQHNFTSTTGNGGASPSDRAVTNNMTLGLAVGLRCLFKNE